MAALMAIDNYGQTVHDIHPKCPKASLLEKVGGKSATPMYRDNLLDGSTQHVGYVVKYGHGQSESWFTLFKVERWVKGNK